MENNCIKKRVSLGYMETEHEKKCKVIGWRWNKKIIMDLSDDKKYMEIRVLDPKQLGAFKLWQNEPRDIQKRVVVSLDLSYVRGAWHVDFVQVDSKYRGQKLGIKLYRFLLRNRIINKLRCGDSQSPGGQGLWNKLCKTRDIEVFAKKTERAKKVEVVIPGAKIPTLKNANWDLYGDANTAIMIAQAA